MSSLSEAARDWWYEPLRAEVTELKELLMAQQSALQTVVTALEQNASTQQETARATLAYLTDLQAQLGRVQSLLEEANRDVPAAVAALQQIDTQMDSVNDALRAAVPQAPPAP